MSLTTTLIGIIAIAVIVWLIYQYAPVIQRMLDGQLGGLSGRGGGDGNQPLYDIFYKYKHQSTEHWLKWVLAQDEETKNRAFEKLQLYLESPPPKLGLCTKDAIVAVAAFKRDDRFDVLKAFLDNIRGHLGALKTIELFYGQLLVSMTKVDLDKGAKVLKEELDYFGQRMDTSEIKYDNFRVKVVRAYKHMDEIPKQSRDTITALLCNGAYSSSLRKEMVKILYERKDKATMAYVYPQLLNYFMQEDIPELNEETIEVLQNLFYVFRDFMKDHTETWKLILESCYSDKIGSQIIELLAGLLSDRTEGFSYEQLMDILDLHEPAKDPLRNALQARNYVSDEEMTIFRSKIKAEDMEFAPDTIVIERSKRTRTIGSALADQYKRLRNITEKDFMGTNKSERRASHTVKLLTGSSAKEKIYLLRALSANENRNFIYIDLARLIYNSAELNKLISTINNAKPAIVYTDNVLQILETNLDDEGKLGLKNFLKTLRELAILPSVTFFGSLSMPGPEVQKHSKLKQIMNSGAKGNYELTVNLDIPSEEDKLEIVTEIVGKITADKLDKNFNPEQLVEPTKGYSFLEFWAEIVQYFEKALLIRGKVIDPKFLFKDTREKEDDSEAEDEDAEAETEEEELSAA
ncbi:MAG: hypothetical protein OXU45_02635 [Candidatus Melainabacteria bacterium]|nr:hypothetical protein [Candidatus Melainabacteria bacterium]